MPKRSTSTPVHPAEAPTVERRVCARRPIARPCKVFRPLTRRFVPARTRNASSSGLLLEIDGAGGRPLAIGERLGVGVAWEHETILGGESMVPGVVVRVGEIGTTRQSFAVRFESAAALAA